MGAKPGRAALLGLLFTAFGWRIASAYAALGAINVAVLASVFVASLSGVQHYVAQQLAQLPADFAVIQQSRVSRSIELAQGIATTVGPSSAATIGVLRVPQERGTLELTANGRALPLRWLVVIGASRPDLLPPELAPSSRRSSAGGGAALVGAAVVSASGSLSLESGDVIGLKVVSSHASGAEQSHTELGLQLAAELPDTLLEVRLPMRPTALRRIDFNRWSLTTAGAMLYLPEDALILAVPPEQWTTIAALFERAFVGTEAEDHGLAPPLYLPEIVHLVKLTGATEQDAWNLPAALRDAVRNRAQLAELGAGEIGDVHVASPRVALLAHMLAVSRLLGVATLLLAAPLLFAAWSVNRSTGELIVSAERRTLGLLQLRGTPHAQLQRALRAAAMIGVIAGGFSGVLIALGVPLLIAVVSGGTVPPAAVFAAAALQLSIFVALGVAAAVLSTRSVFSELRQVTPREAISHIAAAPPGRQRTVSPWALALAGLAFILGGAKILAWLSGVQLATGLLAGPADESTLGALAIADWALGFLAVPLLLGGGAVILRHREPWAHRALAFVVVPLAGPLRWVLHSSGVFDWARRVTVLAICALAVAAVAVPAGVAESLTARARRAMRASVGGDVQLEFAAGAFGPCQRGSVRICLALQQQGMLDVEDSLRARPDVLSVTAISEFAVPSLHVPGQSGGLLDVMDDLESYQRTVYAEESLGLSQPFTAVLSELRAGHIVASAGLMTARHLAPGHVLELRTAGGAAPVRPVAVASLLPGQPARMAHRREGYANAEAEYLLYSDATDSRLYVTRRGLDASALAELDAVANRVVVLAKLSAPLTAGTVARLIDALPVAPDAVRFPSAEEQRWTQDMFVSLALRNLRTLMLAALTLALAGLLAAGFANAAAERRSWELFRLRGLPRYLSARLSLAINVVPVAAGVLLGALLGGLLASALSQALWQLTRIAVPAADVAHRLAFSASSVWMIALLAVLLATAAAVVAWRSAVGAPLPGPRS